MTFDDCCTVIHRSLLIPEKIFSLLFKTYYYFTTIIMLLPQNGAFFQCSKSLEENSDVIFSLAFAKHSHKKFSLIWNKFVF